MTLDFYTENCEVISLPLNVVDKIVINNKEYLIDQPDLHNIMSGDQASFGVYFNQNLLEYQTNNGFWKSALKRLKESDISQVYINNGILAFGICLEWEDDATFNNMQYTKLQRVIEENGKFAFIHNATKIDIAYFYPEWSEE